MVASAESVGERIGRDKPIMSFAYSNYSHVDGRIVVVKRLDEWQDRIYCWHGSWYLINCLQSMHTSTHNNNNSSGLVCPLSRVPCSYWGYIHTAFAFTSSDNRSRQILTISNSIYSAVKWRLQLMFRTFIATRRSWARPVKWKWLVVNIIMLQFDSQSRHALDLEHERCCWWRRWRWWWWWWCTVRYKPIANKPRLIEFRNIWYNIDRDIVDIERERERDTRRFIFIQT